MTRWFMHHLFVWTVRLVVLVVSVFTLARVIHVTLGYRMEYGPMFLGALLIIVVVRVWMPWAPHDDRK